MQRQILGMVGPRINVRAIADALTNGDATIGTTGQRYNGDAILVAIPEYGVEINSAHWSPEAIERLVTLFVEETAFAITNFPAPFYRARYFGAWIRNGILYLDIVEAFPREELNAAIAAGAARNEIAIWDNGRKELIDI